MTHRVLTIQTTGAFDLACLDCQWTATTTTREEAIVEELRHRGHCLRNTVAVCECKERAE